jgi:hypothetical protein
MHTEVYADGIGEITVTGNIVRIDLVSLSPTEKDASNKPLAQFRQRIIMPVDAFANAAELIKKVQAQLIETGAVRMQPMPQHNVAAPVEPPRNGSPNFR